MSSFSGSSNKFCGCPEGFDFVDGQCIKTEVVAAEYTGDLVTVEQGDVLPNAYGVKGLKLYPDITNFTLPIAGRTGLGTLYDNGGYTSAQQPPGVNAVLPYSIAGLTNELWGQFDSLHPTCVQPSGRLNNVGVKALTFKGKLECIQEWNAANPNNLWLNLPTLEQQLDVIRQGAVVFEFCVDVPTEKQYTIGIAADNEVIVSIDGVTAIYLGSRIDDGSVPNSNDSFAHWHVFPVTLTAGQHTIKLEGINDRQSLANQGPTNFSFGAEIYDLTAAEIQADYADPSDSNIPTCGTPTSAIADKILFSTADYIGQQIPALGDGEWICPTSGETLDFCNGVPQCTQVLTAPPLECCYVVESCLDPATTYTISLAEGQPALVIGNIYIFSGDPVFDGVCFSVTEEIACPGTELTDITILTDYKTNDCSICTSCVELINCADPSDTIIIKWNPDDPPLKYINTVYLFDFAPTICYTAQEIIPPCEGSPQYGAVNILDQYEDCDDCLTPCFEVDCVDQTITYTNSDLTSYIGQVISWNDGGEDRCGTVTKKYPCIENPQPVSEIVVLDCFFNCEDCLPEPEPPVPGFELKPRIVKPGYDTPACTPQYFDRVKCRWSEAVYQHMASKRYGIEFCCETDLQKWEIKNEILDIEVTKDPDIDCPTVCPTPES